MIIQYFFLFTEQYAQKPERSFTPQKAMKYNS